MKKFQKMMIAGMMIAMLVAGSSASAKELKAAPTFTKVEFGYFAGAPETASHHQKIELVGFGKHINEYEGQHKRAAADMQLTRKVNEYEGQHR